MLVRKVGASALLAVVCASAVAGTAVGHPVPTTFASGQGLTFVSGALPVSSVVTDQCDGTYATVQVNATIDPVAGASVDVAEGEVCGVRINLSGRVLLSGSGPQGSSFALSLGVGVIEIEVDPALEVPGLLVIRLGDPNWVTATALGLDPNEHVSVGAGHALHNTLRDALRHDSAVF